LRLLLLLLLLLTWHLISLQRCQQHQQGVLVGPERLCLVLSWQWC
jgi:hypothetical protein